MTVPDADTGRTLARNLVESGLCACGNVVSGVESVYRWKGEIHTDPEALVILKTSVERVEALMETARRLHPYDVPELLALPVTEGSDAYVSWVLEQTVEP